jgi:hypothetical protein
MLAKGPGIHRRFSIGNHKFMDEESTGGMKFCRESLVVLMDADSGLQDENARKILMNGNNLRWEVPKCSLPGMSTFLKFKYVNKKIPDLAYYELHIFPMK